MVVADLFLGSSLSSLCTKSAEEASFGVDLRRNPSKELSLDDDVGGG
jgi:hypothetical protein